MGHLLFCILHKWNNEIYYLYKALISVLVYRSEQSQFTQQTQGFILPNLRHFCTTLLSTISIWIKVTI